MTWLVVGMCVFVAVHLVPWVPSLRAGLVARVGYNPYRALFSLIALAGVVMIVVGKGAAEFVPVWQPPAWGRLLAALAVLAAFILLPAAHMPTNIKRFTRHPMLWGVTLWALGHLLANGDRASIVLFGGFALYSLLAMWSANVRGATKSQTVHPVRRDLMVIVAGVVAYAVLLLAHPWLFGVGVIS